jgi:hypothetical protein
MVLGALTVICVLLFVAKCLLLYTPIGDLITTRTVYSMPEEQITSMPQNEQSQSVTQRPDGTRAWVATVNLAVTFSGSVVTKTKDPSAIKIVEALKEFGDTLSDVANTLWCVALVAHAILAQKDRILTSFKDFGALGVRN